MEVPSDWARVERPARAGLGAVDAIGILRCQQFVMSWTMATPGDIPGNWLSPAAGWNVNAFADPNDPTGQTYNITGSYTNALPGTSAGLPGITVGSTAAYTVNSVTFQGPSVAGACAPPLTPIYTPLPPKKPVTQGAGCLPGQTRDTVTGACAPACWDNSSPKNGACLPNPGSAGGAGPGGATTGATSTNTYLMVGFGVLVLGAAGWYFLK